MPSRRLALAACTLLIALGAEAASPTPRVLRVKAVADEAFREKKGWAKEIREHLAWADRKLREVADIGLEVMAVEPWSTHRTPGMSFLLQELRAGVAKEGAEAVIGFTGHPPPVRMVALPGGPVRYPLPFAAGIAFPLGDRVVVRRTEWEALTRHTLLHEIAHLFGGLHVDEDSLMETGTDRMSYRLDPFNRRVLDLTRDRDFNVGIRNIPDDGLSALAGLYRQAPPSEDPDTAVRVGYILMLAGEIEDALVQFRRVNEIAPVQTRNVLRHAVLPELAARTLGRDPSVEGRHGLAQVHVLAQDWSEAADLLEPGCEKAPPHAPSCALLGEVYRRVGVLDRAETVLRAALARDDSLAEAHATLARVWASRERYDQALEEFGKALALRPRDVDVLFDAGLACLEAGQAAAAEARFREVLRLDEERAPARSRLAVALVRQNRGREARSLIKPFEERRRLPAVVLRDMAEVYLLSGDERKAFETLQLAKKGGIDVAAVETLVLERTGGTREVAVEDLVEQAQAYFRSGDLETARSLLERAAQAEAREARVPYWRGRVAAAEGDEDQARSHFEQALEVDSDYLPPRYELGRFAYEAEDWAGAVRWLRPYVEAGKEDSSALLMLGRSELETGAQEKAEEHLRAAIRIRADDGSFFYFLGLALLAQGRDAEARHELEMAVESPSIPEWRREDAHLRLARLAEAAGEEATAERHVAAALRSPETTSEGAAGAPGIDRVTLVRVEPSPSRALPRGQPVRIVATVRFALATADHGTLLLVPQDEDGTPLLHPQPRATVRRGTGEVTLEARVTAPAAGAHLDVFLVLHPRGRRTSSAAARARFALE